MSNTPATSETQALTKNTSLDKKAHSQNGFLNLIINIFLPVFILNKGHKWGLTPTQAVILALCFPLFYGLYSSIKEKKINFISLLGLLNILISGTLTILALGGIWFSIKEAAFPLLIGIFVLISSYKDNPFFEVLFLNPQAFNVEKINQSLATQNNSDSFRRLMQKSTRWLSLSFLMSAVLNFLLADYIFKPLDPLLTTEQQQQTLNEQLSQMTLYSNFVILIPSMIFLGLILYFSVKEIQKLTNLKTEDLFHS